MARMHYLRHLRTARTRIIIGAVACLALLAYLDWITGPSVSVTCFYLIPVFFLSWYGGKKVGFLVAAIHALLWLTLDFRFQVHATFFLLVWNFGIRLITFGAVVLLVELC